MMYFIKRFFTGSLFFILLPAGQGAFAAAYAFATHWEIRAPLGEVWTAIYHAESWPEWWKGVEVATIRPGSGDGTGTVMDFAWQSRLFYKLRFRMELTEKEDRRLLRGVATGDLEGTGTWYFREENNITYIDYHWQVRTTRPWMNLFSFLLRPAFRKNHDILMKRGAEGLARKLNADLIAYH